MNLVVSDVPMKKSLPTELRSFYKLNIHVAGIPTTEIGCLINVSQRSSQHVSGSHYRFPENPIWVYYTHEHWAVLYSANDEKEPRRRANMIYNFPGMLAPYVTITVSFTIPFSFKDRGGQPHFCSQT